jgi:dephospho-CoA kinase
VPDNSFRLGLTGGIASGKSTVAAALAVFGAYVIDADAIARSATSQNGPAIHALRGHFGPTIVNDMGQVDRDRLRQLVFSNPQAKLALEAIVHPIVGQTITQQALQAEHQGAPCIVFDIPLLIETGSWRRQLHRILVVDCTPATQIARVQRRNGLNQEDAVKILAAQAPRGQRLAAADAVLFNDGFAIAHVQELVREMAPQFGL